MSITKIINYALVMWINGTANGNTLDDAINDAINGAAGSFEEYCLMWDAVNEWRNN